MSHQLRNPSINQVTLFGIEPFTRCKFVKGMIELLFDIFHPMTFFFTGGPVGLYENVPIHTSVTQLHLWPYCHSIYSTMYGSAP